MTCTSWLVWVVFPIKAGADKDVPKYTSYEVAAEPPAAAVQFNVTLPVRMSDAPSCGVLIAAHKVGGGVPLDWIEMLSKSRK